MPSGKPLYTLDRIDVDGSYCKENCRWATWKDQMSNIRRNIHVYLWGEDYSLSEACRALGLKVENIHSLLGKRNKKVKRTPEEALAKGLSNLYRERISYD